MAYLGRRRWLGVLVLVLVAVAVLDRRHANGPIEPVAPGALAIALNGNLLIADRSRHEVLEREPDGAFVVAVGSGVAGDEGDGSSALSAPIVAPTSMAVTANGTLYFAQPAGGEIMASVVREVAPDGVISTVVGAHPHCHVPGASARSISAEDADLAAPALAIGAHERLELAGSDCPGILDGGPLLALTPGGRLVEAPDVAAPAGCVPDALAVAPAGATALACGGHAKETLLLEPGAAVRVLAGVGASGLASDRDGTFVAIEGDAVVRLSAAGVRTLAELGRGSPGARQLGRGESMGPDGITVGGDGSVYVASTAAPGHGDFTGLVEIDAAGRLRVLWRS